MKVIVMSILSVFVLACSQKKEVFSLAEANECLLESDKSAVWEAVEWIKKADEARTKNDEKFMNTSKELTSLLISCMRRVSTMTPSREGSVRLPWPGF